MASAVEMLSGEKKRLPPWFRNRPYSATAKALLPSTTVVRSAAATGFISTPDAPGANTREGISNDNRSFTRTPQDARPLRPFRLSRPSVDHKPLLAALL